MCSWVLLGGAKVAVCVGCRVDGGKKGKNGGRVGLYRRILALVGDSYQWPKEMGEGGRAVLRKRTSNRFCPYKNMAFATLAFRSLFQLFFLVGKIDMLQPNLRRAVAKTALV